MEKKNVAVSVRAKLLNIRDSVPGTEYMQILFVSGFSLPARGTLKDSVNC